MGILVKKIFVLNSISEKDSYYSDRYNLKILKDDALAVYEGKAKVITAKVRVDNKIDAKSTNDYKYYNNINGVRFEKD